MIKIKDIYERLHKDQKEYTELRFLMARRVFVIVVAAYFTSLLFTIGGFYVGTIITIPMWSAITFHLYSILIISVVWFAFSIAEYFGAIYLPGKSWFAYVVGVVFLVIGGLALFVHLSPLFS